MKLVAHNKVYSIVYIAVARARGGRRVGASLARLSRSSLRLPRSRPLHKFETSCNPPGSRNMLATQIKTNKPLGRPRYRPMSCFMCLRHSVVVVNQVYLFQIGNIRMLQS